MTRPGRADDAIVVRSYVTATTRDVGSGVRRAGPLTPYFEELILADAARARPGGSVSLTVPAATKTADLVRLWRRIATRMAPGVRVTIEREHRETWRAPSRSRRAPSTR